MPELPDLRILADAFSAALWGRSVLSASVRQPIVMRGTSSELGAFQGATLDRVAQRGKFLTLHFGADRIVINAMLTGRLGLAPPGSRVAASTALVLTFGPRHRVATAQRIPDWTAGASWLPPDDATIELRYRDPRRMGKIYLVPDGSDREVVGWEGMGPDADDPAFDLPAWRARIARHHGELLPLLKNQAFVAGIGNAYSDEVLWDARLGPFRKRSTLADEESERLWRACHTTMAWAIDELRVRVPPRFDEQARDFLRVHRRGGQPCPHCGTTLSEVAPGGFVTTWCRACQA